MFLLCTFGIILSLVLKSWSTIFRKYALFPKMIYCSCSAMWSSIKYANYHSIAGHKETFIVVCQTIMQCLNSELYHAYTWADC